MFHLYLFAQLNATTSQEWKFHYMQVYFDLITSEYVTDVL
jgi:hypothetical protein